MNQAGFLLFVLSPWMPGLLCGVTTQDSQAVLEGKSLTVPCYYDPEYASSVKYWCRGSLREFCTSLARTDDTLSGDKVSIVDDPVQQLFTVTMTNMKVEDAGWYMCGVEIGGFWTADVRAFTNIRVIPGMWVVNDRLSGEEGSSVTVECLYSERHRESEKKWCRSGDWNSCLRTGPGGNFEDSSVAIDDHQTGTLTITLKRLQMRDMGWYWCSAGQQNVAVHVQVAPRPSTTPLSVTSRAATSQAASEAPPPKLATKDSWMCQVFTSETMMMMCASFVLFVGLGILARRLHKHRYFAKLRQTTGRTPSCEENAWEGERLKIPVVI